MTWELKTSVLNRNAHARCLFRKFDKRPTWFRQLCHDFQSDFNNFHHREVCIHRAARTDVGKHVRILNCSLGTQTSSMFHSESVNFMNKFRVATPRDLDEMNNIWKAINKPAIKTEKRVFVFPRRSTRIIDFKECSKTLLNRLSNSSRPSALQATLRNNTPFHPFVFNSAFFFLDFVSTEETAGRFQTWKSVFHW